MRRELNGPVTDPAPIRFPDPRDPDVQKRLMGSGFTDDDGTASPELTEALRAYDTAPQDAVRYAAVLRAFAASRVLVPVVAVLGEVEYDEQGLAHDKSSDMATVLLTGADGRQALLAFTSTVSLRAWQADARPVPVAASDAAKAALQDAADALVVDLAGPVRFVVEGETLRRLARGEL